jgi:hypothetical protein
MPEFKPFEWLGEEGVIEHPFFDVHEFMGEYDIVVDLEKYARATMNWDFSI